MRFDKLGRTFTLLSVLLILGLAAINLITIGLYGRVNAELVREQADRQEWEVANWASQVSSMLRLGDGPEMRIQEMTMRSWGSRADEDIGPAAFVVYQPDGQLLTRWFRSAEMTEKDLAERQQLEAVIPPQLIADPDPCSEIVLAKMRLQAPRSRIHKAGKHRYTVFTVPIFHPAGMQRQGGECVSYSLIVFRGGTFDFSWPLLATLLQILTIITISVGGLFFLRVLLRPNLNPVAHPDLRDFIGSETHTTEFLVGSFRSLIDGLQVEHAELSRLHDLEKERAAFIEQFNERIVSSIAGGLIVVEQTGYVVIANGYARKLFVTNAVTTLSESEMSRLSPLKNVHYQEFFERAPRLCELIASCLQERQHVALDEFEARRATGSSCWLAATVSPIGWRSGATTVPGVLCFVSDFTEVIELRQSLRLQENLAHLGEMAAGIAHEFKNSLATILGYGQLLQSINADNTVQTSSTALVDEVKHLSQVVTDFLNFARPQQLQRFPVSLAELIDDCREAMLDKATAAGVTLTVTGQFPEVLGDSTLLRRAFLNLIENGIDAINSESPRKEITINGFSASQDDQQAIVEFSDTGQGIPASELDKIFIPFFTTKSRGYGIGLALVQKILLGHQGSVKVVSQEGQGSTFICTLPRSQE